MPGPWNNWYHAMMGTFGSWLPGDPRGWRERHHRRHVDGDYRHPPPPGVGDHLHDRSDDLMRRPPVTLPPEQRVVVCRALAQRMIELGAEVVELSVSAKHVHALVRFRPLTPPQNPGIAMPGLCPENSLQDGRDPLPRHMLGLAKKHASHVLRQMNLRTDPGGIWAVRSKLEPVKDREHQLNVVSYIRRHESQGAVLWSRLRPPRS
jgi:hypothetical protein